MTICNVCTLNLRQANHALQNDAALLAAREREPRHRRRAAYSGGVEVMHFLWLISGRRGLRAAAGRGAQRASRVSRSRRSTAARSCARRSSSASRTPTGPSRSSGSSRPAAASRSTTRRRSSAAASRSSRRARTSALAELIQPIEQAKEAGADAMVTPCPLCHLSLDAWQSKLRKQTGKDFQMPILHLSQLDRRRRRDSRRRS